MFSHSRPTPFISPRVQGDADIFQTQFASADPFKHVVIDNFLDDAVAERLLADFPAFRPELAKNEYGEIATKAVNTNLPGISPVYEEFYSYIRSQDFLDLMSRISGIPDLILDPKMYGGGTHENLHGQGMFTHVDFNYDEALNLHRRLNLLIYLNKDWKEEWGGSIALHSNPRRPKEDRVRAFLPIFNRCVLFETNEYSWHGFQGVNLPPEERHRSRKSISIYLYTKERPQEEIAPPHGTFYVHDPLPSWLRLGVALDDAQIGILQGMLSERDKYIEFYQQQELRHNADFLRQAAYIKELLNGARLPLTGYVLQEGPGRGFYPDGWAGPRLEFRLAPIEPVQDLVIAGWRPDDAPGPLQLQVVVAGEETVTATRDGGLFEVPVQMKRARTEAFTVAIEVISQPRPSSPSDNRELEFIIKEVKAIHPKKRFSLFG